METIIKDRLIEAAKLADQMTDGHGTTAGIEIIEQGVICKMFWTQNQRLYKVENQTNWRAVEVAPKNPLISALASLTKQASAS